MSMKPDLRGIERVVSGPFKLDNYILIMFFRIVHDASKEDIFLTDLGFATTGCNFLD